MASKQRLDEALPLLAAIPWLIAAGGTAFAAYDAYKAYKEFMESPKEGSDLAALVGKFGLSVALGIISVMSGGTAVAARTLSFVKFKKYFKPLMPKIGKKVKLNGEQYKWLGNQWGKVDPITGKVPTVKDRAVIDELNQRVVKHAYQTSVAAGLTAATVAASDGNDAQASDSDETVDNVVDDTVNNTADDSSAVSAEPEPETAVTREPVSDNLAAFAKSGKKGLANDTDEIPAIKELQTRLKQLGYGIVVDGKYGPNTKDAVSEFQKTLGTSVDGDAGPATIPHIINISKLTLEPFSSYNDFVKSLRRLDQLTESGDDIGNLIRIIETLSLMEDGNYQTLLAQLEKVDVSQLPTNVKSNYNRIMQKAKAKQAAQANSQQSAKPEQKVKQQLDPSKGYHAQADAGDLGPFHQHSL